MAKLTLNQRAALLQDAVVRASLKDGDFLDLLPQAKTTEKVMGCHKNAEENSCHDGGLSCIPRSPKKPSSPVGGGWRVKKLRCSY